MSVKEFAQKFIKAEDDAWLNGRFDALEKLETPDVVYHIPPNPDVVGWEAHKQYISGTRTAVSDIHQDWEFIAGDGNVFALSYEMRGMFTGEVPGMPPPTGKEITIDSLMVFSLKDGRIKEVWSNSNITGLG